MYSYKKHRKLESDIRWVHAELECDIWEERAESPVWASLWERRDYVRKLERAIEEVIAADALPLAAA